MSRAYDLPKRCPFWSGTHPVAYVALQPWWRDLGGEHPNADVEEVMFAMDYRRRRLEPVVRQLAKFRDEPMSVLRRALDAPHSPLLLESWVPGPSGRHWALYVLGADGRLLGWAQLPRLRPDRRRIPLLIP